VIKQGAFQAFSDDLLKRMSGSVTSGQEAAFDFGALALQLFRLQYEHVPPYRRWCDAQNVSPDRVSDWTQIPAVPTAAFREFDFTSLPPQERKCTFYSSGTTGAQRSRHFHSAESLRVYEASLLPWFRRHVLGGTSASGNLELSAELVLVALTPAGSLAPHSSLVHMFETVRRKVAFQDAVFLGDVGKDGEWLLRPDQAIRVLRQFLQESRPVLLVGAAFSFVQLLDYIISTSERLRFPPGSRALETGGYKGRSRQMGKVELRKLIADWLGIGRSNVVSEYGMCELSSQAYDRVLGGADTGEAPGPFHFPPWARARVVSPETGQEVADGESGLLRVIDLANVYSVLAVQTADLAVRRGAGFEWKGRATGAEPRGCSLMAGEL
jgi:hypothetical protein